MLTLMSKTRQAATARFSPGAVAIGMALTVLSSPASAFDADQLVRTAWEGFKTACGQAVTDPQGYLNAAPGLAPAGTRPVASSPDGRVVSTSILRNRVEEDVQFLGFGDRMLVLCHVSAIDGVMTGGLPQELLDQMATNPQMMNDPNVLAQIEGNLRAMETMDLRAADTALGAALAQTIAQDPGATLIGGPVPVTGAEDYMVVPYNDGSSAGQRNYHSFGVAMEFGTVPVHVFAQVEYGGLWVGVSHMIGPSQ